MVARAERIGTRLRVRWVTLPGPQRACAGQPSRSPREGDARLHAGRGGGRRRPRAGQRARLPGARLRHPGPFRPRRRHGGRARPGRACPAPRGRAVRGRDKQHPPGSAATPPPSSPPGSTSRSRSRHPTPRPPRHSRPATPRLSGARSRTTAACRCAAAERGRPNPSSARSAGPPSAAWPGSRSARLSPSSTTAFGTDPREHLVPLLAHVLLRPDRLQVEPQQRRRVAGAVKVARPTCRGAGSFAAPWFLLRDRGHGAAEAAGRALTPRASPTARKVLGVRTVIW